jgi:hypothetical protein
MSLVTHEPRSAGYAEHMLAVVVVLPIVLMISACLLERFEAHATRVRPTTPVRRPATVQRAESTQSTQSASAPAAPALSLVPATGGETPDPEADVRRAVPVTLDADTLRLPKAS